MKLFSVALTFVFAISATITQDNKTANEPDEKLEGFQWLKQFEGEWDTAQNGTMKCRVVGKRWLINEISFGGGTYSVQTLGYDAKTKRFVGSWVDASSSFIWRYQGSLDDQGTTLVLEAEGPDMSDSSKTRKYQDRYEFKSPDEIIATARILNDQGEWQRLSKSTMKRKK